MNNKILHISDLHFGREKQEVLLALENKIKEIKPDIIIISGDLTQRAKKKEFMKVHRFLSNLNFPYFIIPGNHDLPVFNIFKRFINPWKRWKKFIQRDLESTFKNEKIAIYGLNSVRKMGVWFDFERGVISFTQKIKIKSFFENITDEKLKIVVAHHPFWLPDEQMFRDIIKGRDKAIEYFNEVGVDIILGGHIHLSFVKLFKNIIISHAGTCISNRTIKNNNNSFSLITGNNKEVFIELCEFNNNSFECVESHKFRKKDNLWNEIN